jgi:hypothetical protein
MIRELHMLILASALSVVSCLSKPTGGDQATAPSAALSAEQGPSPALIAIAAAPVESTATVSFDDYGAESGSVGIPECDRCVQVAAECNAKGYGEAAALLAQTKQQWLVWKRVARQARSPEERDQLRAQCREAIDKLDEQVDALGCRGSAGGGR